MGLTITQMAMKDLITNFIFHDQSKEVCLIVFVS